VTLEVTGLVDQLLSRTNGLDAPRLWAESGAMALTGDPGGDALGASAPVAALVQAAADMIGEVAPTDGIEVLADPPALLGERAAILALGRRGQVSCGGGTRLLRAADGWVAVALPRPEDRAAVPAWLGLLAGTGGREVSGEGAWGVVADAVADRLAGEAATAARLLEIPCAVMAEAPPAGTPWAAEAGPAASPVRWPLVVDLSALWAGPLCADLLRRAGARVIKVEDPSRPDGSRLGWPAFADVLNAGKESVAVDLTSAGGRRDLARLLAAADAVVTSSRPRAFERLGVDVDAVLARSPTVWVAVTGHGWNGPGRDRVGFGDDAAVAGGLVAIGPADGAPRFLADAVADPLTGVLAALVASTALSSGGSWFVDAALARAASFAAGLGPVPDAHPGPRSPRARPAAATIRPLGADTTAVLAELDP
jgi:crotonobetainyl-CoA:carnitine CoA-transferase CaiB-like acyl-CoA transferase